MTKICWRFVVAAALIAQPVTAKEKVETPIDPGPPPVSVQEFRRIATEALLASFFDPGSAQITWDRGITGGYWKPPFSKKVPGWFTCGLVNAKNRMGGYVGARRFVVVEYMGRAVLTDVDQGGAYGFVGMACDKAIKTGVLPASDADTLPDVAINPDTPIYGFGRLSVVPDGAYIGAVVPGSPASDAGLVTGMVLSHINGVPLKGFDQVTVDKILRATESKVTLTIIGKGDITLTKGLPHQ